MNNAIVTSLIQPPVIQPPVSWRDYFKSPKQMKITAKPFLIKGFLPPGVTFLGGPSGHGKTWVAISLAKALYTGQDFLGFFPVAEKTNVIYLIPECTESAFKGRLTKFGLTDADEGFLCQTLSDGPAISLLNPFLLQAVQELRPVVFLDTAVRFNPSDDENDSMQTAKGLGALVFGLIGNGAQAVVPLHHSPKYLVAAAKESSDAVKLENTLRGTGDLGAIADAVYCVLCSDLKNFRATISCVKPREFEPPEPFEIQGRPYIDLEGDLKLVRPPHVGSEVLDAQDAARVGKAIEANREVTHRELAKVCGVNKNRIRNLAKLAGWHQPYMGSKVSERWERIIYQ